MGTIIIMVPTIIKGKLFDGEGELISFKKSLTASANGTIRPRAPGLLGPLRMWIYPRTLRSIRVKKATAIITIIRIMIIPIFNS